MSDIILSSGPSGIISNIDSVYILNKKNVYPFYE